MTYTITVQYPADAKFDMDYYLKHHMPMVEEEFKPFGFKGYSVTNNLKTPDPNQPSPHSVLALLFFETESGFVDALKSTGAKVLGDVPNFSDKGPVIVGGDNVASTVGV